MTKILTDVYYFYRKNFLALLLYILPVSLLINIVSLTLTYTFAGSDELEQAKFLLIINFFINPLYLGGLIFLLSRLVHGQSAGLSQCLGFALYKWMVLFSVSILYGVLTGIGLFLFILPGIWIFTRLIMAPFLVALDNLSPLDAIGESFRLTADEFWNILGSTLLVFLSLLLIQQFLVNSLPDNAVIRLSISVFGDILWSLLTVIWFRFYDLLKNGN